MSLTILFSVLVSYQNIAKQNKDIEPKVEKKQIRKDNFRVYSIEYVE